MSSKTNEENNPDMDLYVNNNDNIFMWVVITIRICQSSSTRIASFLLSYEK